MSKKKSESRIKSGVYEKNKIQLADIITSIKKNHVISDAGAIFTFTGIVRNTSLSGKEVKAMEIDAYEKMANQSIIQICQKMKKRKSS